MSDKRLADKLAAVDLFCGCGGMTHGFILEGIKVVAGIDADPSCRYAYETNNNATFIEKNIENVSGSELRALYPAEHKKILIGCAPCQPFSKYSIKRKIGSDWRLLYEFARLVVETKPDVVSMENVPELGLRDRKYVLTDFVDALKNAGYHVSYSFVHCTAYRIPQTRIRLVLLASLLGEIKIVEKKCPTSECATVRTTIGHLLPLRDGDVDPNDPLHRSSRLSDLNRKRIRASVPGGTWRDWPNELKLACHKRNSGRKFPSVYGRMSWDSPSSTITTQFYGIGNGRFGHPDQDRAISLREAALLQTFPSDYKFFEPDKELKLKEVGKHIGNAVPPELGRIIARSIIIHLENVHA